MSADNDDRHRIEAEADEVEREEELQSRARPDEQPRDAPAGPPGSATGGIHAAGTPAGGLAPGGSAGSNTPTGTPNMDEVEDALGSSQQDHVGDIEESQPPYAGPSGGAVGGTPAEKRSSGGNRPDGINPASPRRGDSTIGSDPDQPD